MIVNELIVWVAALVIDVVLMFSSEPEVATAPSMRTYSAEESNVPGSDTAARKRKYPAVPVATATPDHVSVAVFDTTPDAGAPNDKPFTASTPPDIFAYEAVMVVRVAVTTNVFGETPDPGWAEIVTTAPDAVAAYSGEDGLALIAAARSDAV